MGDVRSLAAVEKVLVITATEEKVQRDPGNSDQYHQNKKAGEHTSYQYHQVQRA